MPKTYNHLFEKITDFDNLYEAAKLAKKGKPLTAEISRFHFNLERELLNLQEELRSKIYQPGAYRTFSVFEPKERMISAAPYRDRKVIFAMLMILYYFQMKNQL